MSALFQVTYSIQSISLLILAPNEKKNVVKKSSLSPAQLGIFNRPGGTFGDSGASDICSQLTLTPNRAAD